MVDTPFFIVGCVRSGTTLLRTILRTHPRLCCPEETQYFRWGDPFGTAMFEKFYLEIPNDLKNKEPVYKLHRQIDNIRESEFIELLKISETRASFQDRYYKLYMERNGFSGRRWFNKSPQDIYGLLMLNSFYDKPKFIHLIRNPIDVVASMKVGEVIQAPLKGACNYWLEAVNIFDQFKTAWPNQCFEVCFEEFIMNTKVVTERLLEFLGEDQLLIGYDFSCVRSTWRDYKDVLSNEEISVIDRICGKVMERYGYERP
ncbi:MAG: sulfotransferase [Rhodospirillaceae bacterium]